MTTEKCCGTTWVHSWNIRLWCFLHFRSGTYASRICQKSATIRRSADGAPGCLQRSIKEKNGAGLRICGARFRFLEFIDSLGYPSAFSAPSIVSAVKVFRGAPRSSTQRVNCGGQTHESVCQDSGKPTLISNLLLVMPLRPAAESSFSLFRVGKAPPLPTGLIHGR